MTKFTLSINLNIHRNRYYCFENFYKIQEIPLRGHKVRVWFAVNARKIILLIFVKKHTLTSKFK
jgi:hypothetical protein